MVDFTEDILDGRDILKEFEEMEQELKDLQGYVEDAEDAGELKAAQQELDDFDMEHFELLKSFVDDVGDQPLRNGETFIHEFYFTRYAEQLADDLWAIDRDVRWPLTHIDWEAAAADLKHDYTPVDVDGNTYYYRG